jgi:hypothetical protein
VVRPGPNGTRREYIPGNTLGGIRQGPAAEARWQEGDLLTGGYGGGGNKNNNAKRGMMPDGARVDQRIDQPGGGAAPFFDFDLLSGSPAASPAVLPKPDSGSENPDGRWEKPSIGWDGGWDQGGWPGVESVPAPGLGSAPGVVPAPGVGSAPASVLGFTPAPGIGSAPAPGVGSAGVGYGPAPSVGSSPAISRFSAPAVNPRLAGAAASRLAGLLAHTPPPYYYYYYYY